MTIHIHVTDFRRVETARVVLDKLAFIGGHNGNGKTSLTQAIGIAMTGEKMPAKLGLTKLAECGVLVRSGTPEATIKVSVGAPPGPEATSWASMTYPNPEYKQGPGEPIRCSRYAVGLESVLDLDDKKRAMELARILKTEPSFGDLLDAIQRAEVISRDGLPRDPLEDAEAKEMEALGLDPESTYDLRLYRYVVSLWRDIQGKGWEAVLKTVQEAGRKHKASWEVTTGEKAYQPTGADSWTPDNPNWDASLLTVSRESLEADITRARDALESEVGQGAVDKDLIARLQAASEAYDLAGHNKAAQTLAQYETEIPKEEAKLAALPKPEDTPVVVTCPHCGADSQLIVQHGKEPLLQKEIVGLSAEENAARRKAIQDQTDLVNRYKSAAQGYRTQCDRFETDKKQAAEAKTKLDELLAAPDNSEAIDAARKALDVAQERLKLREQKEAADKYHRAVQANQKVIDILAPDGLRKRKLGGVLEVFNSTQLAPICEAGGFPKVVLDDRMGFRLGGFPFPLLAESHQFIVRTVVQLAIARILADPLVVIDGVDVLDTKFRRGMLNAVLNHGIPAIMLGTINTPEKMPPAFKLAGGTSYWLDNGVARQVVDLVEGKAVFAGGAA
jgi:hypothetical protein